MGVLTTGNTFSTGDQVTASKLNDAVNSATFQSAAVDNTSTQLSGGAIIVKDLGITQGKISSDAVGTNQLANDVVISTSGSITGAAGSFTTLAASGDVTFDTTTLKVDSTNNRVGILNTSPAVPLDVNGSARVVGTFFVGTDDTDPHGLLEVYGGGTGQNEGGEIKLRTAADFDSTYNHYFLDTYQDDFRIGRDGIADIHLTSDGNVGIGTASPEAELHVQGPAGNAAEIYVTDGNDTGAANSLLIQQSGGSSFIRNRKSSGPLYLGAGDGNHITILSGGNVGIGTTDPVEKLQVVGNVRIGDGAGVLDDLVLKGSDGIGPSSVGGSSSAAIITTNGTPTGSGHVGIEVPSNDNNDGFYVATDPNQTGTADLLALKINALGNVGIGETSPSAPLTVTSTTGGVLMPRMTTTQMNAISSPANGEMIYNTTANKFYGYANGAWVALH